MRHAHCDETCTTDRGTRKGAGSTETQARKPHTSPVITCGCECHRGQRTTGLAGHCNYNGGCGGMYRQTIAEHHDAYAQALAERIEQLLSVVPAGMGEQA